MILQGFGIINIWACLQVVALQSTKMSQIQDQSSFAPSIPTEFAWAVLMDHSGDTPSGPRKSWRGELKEVLYCGWAEAFTFFQEHCKRLHEDAISLIPAHNPGCEIRVENGRGEDAGLCKWYAKLPGKQEQLVTLAWMKRVPLRKGLDKAGA